MINTGIPYTGDTLVAAFVWGAGTWIMEHLIESQQYSDPECKGDLPLAYRRPAPGPLSVLEEEWPSLKRYLKDHPVQMPLLVDKHRVFEYVFEKGHSQRLQRFRCIAGLENASEREMEKASVFSLRYLWKNPET